MIIVLVEAGVLAPERQVQLDESERHHLRVRRAREGERVQLLDGLGGSAEGTVVGSPSEGLIQITSHQVVPRPVRRGIAVGAGDRDRFGWLAEKAAELGVTDLVPLETERTHNVGTRVRESQVEKLQRRALEAIKQSGAAWAPLVQSPMDLNAFVEREQAGVRWLADFEGASPPSVAGSESAWTAVGPEGGFTDDERARLRDSGWWPVRLAGHVLRFETAAIVAAVLMTSRDS